MPRKHAAAPKYADPRPLVERPIHEPSAGRKTNRSVTLNLAESPLSWLHSRGHLTDRQLLAGEKLRGDYEAAAMGPQVTMRWENVPLSREKRGAPSGLNQTERMISAKKRFDEALAALGPDLADIAWRVILRRRDDAGCRAQNGMAGAVGQAGAADCARQAGGILPVAGM